MTVTTAGGGLFGELVDGFVADLAGSGKESKETLFYRTDPVAWFVDRLGVREDQLIWSKSPAYAGHKWDGNPDPFAFALNCLAEEKDVGIESGTGTGKTFVGAGAILWFLENWENAIVVTLAPKSDQLKLHIWKELSAMWPKFKSKHPLANLTTLSLKMRGTEEWAATGFPVQVKAGESAATRAQGFHAEHMLFITEETPGIDPAVMVAVENTCISPHNLRLGLGNPDHQADALHQFCVLPTVEHIRVSSLDHPNVVADDSTLIPGAVSTKKVKDRELRYGPDSRLYRSRVRGLCPTESAESIIRWAWCTAASNRELSDLPEDKRQGPRAMGVDVANSPNGDESAIAEGIGPRLLEVNTKPCPDANILGADVNALMSVTKTDETRVAIDGIGVGAGTVNELKRLDKNVVNLQSAAPPVPNQDEEEYGNLRAQMWWQMRLDLQHGEVILPYDEELFQELTTPQWEPRGGKIWVEEKKVLKTRLRHSPNKAESAVYWNWVRRDRAAASGHAGQLPF